MNIHQMILNTSETVCLLAQMGLKFSEIVVSIHFSYPIVMLDVKAICEIG